jgi:hypothetical protein
VGLYALGIFEGILQVFHRSTSVMFMAKAQADCGQLGFAI